MDLKQIYYYLGGATMRWGRKQLFLLVFVFILMLAGCATSDQNEKKSDRLQVYTTIYPLEYFAKRVGGERVQVKNLVPVGTDSHDYEPSPKDLTRLAESDLLIYNGANFEPWIEKIQHLLDKKQMVNATHSLPLVYLEEKEESDHHHDDSTNPHVWLDPQLAKKQAEQIKNGLVRVDPKSQQYYEANYRHLANEFDRLDQEFQAAIRQKKTDKIVVSHDAFTYLAKRYGLKQIAIAGLSPMNEPSPQKLKQIVDTIQEHQLRYIFFETLANSKLAETVQREAKVHALTLHPLEGLTKEEADSGEDYFSIMRKNKVNLQKALVNE